MRPATKNNSSAPPTKAHGGRVRASSGSSSSSEWESSPHSNDVGRPRRPSNRGRRDFAERKELRGVNPPPASSHPSTKGKAVPEPPKVSLFIMNLLTKSYFKFFLLGGNQTNKVNIEISRATVKEDNE